MRRLFTAVTAAALAANLMVPTAAAEDIPLNKLTPANQEDINTFINTFADKVAEVEKKRTEEELSTPEGRARTTQYLVEADCQPPSYLPDQGLEPGGTVDDVMDSIKRYQKSDNQTYWDVLNRYDNADSFFEGQTERLAAQAHDSSLFLGKRTVNPTNPQEVHYWIDKAFIEQFKKPIENSQDFKIGNINRKIAEKEPEDRDWYELTPAQAEDVFHAAKNAATGEIDSFISIYKRVFTKGYTKCGWVDSSGKFTEKFRSLARKDAPQTPAGNTPNSPADNNPTKPADSNPQHGKKDTNDDSGSSTTGIIIAVISVLAALAALGAAVSGMIPGVSLPGVLPPAR